MAEKNKTQEQKPSYEELMNIIGQQQAALKDKRRMEELQETGARLSFLFKVVELSDKFPQEYVDKTVSDIMEILPAGERPDEEKPAGPYAVEPENNGE